MLRGIAALCVLCLHIPVAFPHVTTPFEKAYLAVDFFFMLSGFVLTRTYHQRFLAGLGTGRFMALRLKRLWPTIVIGAVCGLISQIDGYPPQDLALFFVMNLALLPYLAGGVVFPLNGVIWSILFELVANFFHAKALVRISQTALLLLALAMAIVMVMAVVKLESFGAGSWDVGSWKGNFAAGLPRVILSYVIGCLLYLRFGDQAQLGLPPWVPPVLLPAALVAGWQIDGGWRFDLIFVLLVCPAVLMAGLASSGSIRWLQRMAGDLSFPLYAVHLPILFLVAQAGLPWFAGPPVALLAAVITLRLTQRRSRPVSQASESTLPAHSQA